MNKNDLMKFNRVKAALISLRPEKFHSRLEKTFIKFFLTTADILIIFQICPKTAYRWRKDLTLPHKKVRGMYFYTWNGILGLLDDWLFGDE